MRITRRQLRKLISEQLRVQTEAVEMDRVYNFQVDSTVDGLSSGVLYYIANVPEESVDKSEAAKYGSDRFIKPSQAVLDKLDYDPEKMSIDPIDEIPQPKIIDLSLEG